MRGHFWAVEWENGKGIADGEGAVRRVLKA